MFGFKEVAQKLHTDLSRGLTASEALRRQKFNGYNEFEINERESIWRKYLEQVVDFFGLL